MPVESGVDRHGAFYRWGSSGKKYHYDPKSDPSREEAYRKAAAQGRAIKAREENP